MPHCKSAAEGTTTRGRVPLARALVGLALRRKRWSFRLLVDGGQRQQHLSVQTAAAARRRPISGQLVPAACGAPLHPARAHAGEAAACALTGAARRGVQAGARGAGRSSARFRRGAVHVWRGRPPLEPGGGALCGLRGCTGRLPRAARLLQRQRCARAREAGPAQRQRGSEVFTRKRRERREGARAPRTSRGCRGAARRCSRLEAQRAARSTPPRGNGPWRAAPPHGAASRRRGTQSVGRAAGASVEADGGERESGRPLHLPFPRVCADRRNDGAPLSAAERTMRLHIIDSDASGRPSCHAWFACACAA